MRLARNLSVLGFLPFLLAFLGSDAVPQDESKRQYKIGDSVGDFMLPTLDGTEVNVNAFRGRVLLINFFASW